MGKLTVRIESKLFSCDYDKKKNGNFVRIVEKHGRRSFEITVEVMTAVWIADIVDDFLLSPQTQKFFRKTNCNGGFLWIHKTKNKRGSSLEVTRVQSLGGGGGNLVLPSDVGCKVWRAFRELIMDFLYGKEEIFSTQKVSSYPSPNSDLYV